MECIELRNEIRWIQGKLPVVDSHHNDLELSVEQPTTVLAAVDQAFPNQSQVAALVVSPEGSYLNDGADSGSNAENSNPKELGVTQEVTSPTPEPRSLHSSPSHAHKARRSRSRKGRSRHQVKGGTFRGGGGFEPPETFGTFTSAAPTPDSQQNILLESPKRKTEQLHEEVEEQETNPQSERESVNGDPAVDGHAVDLPKLETEPFSQQQPQDTSAPSLFIESHSKSWLNEWGFYQAVRLLQIKNRLMQPVIRLREKKGGKLNGEENL